MNYETENMGFKAQFTEDNYTFEEMRSMEQDLSFDAAANAFLTTTYRKGWELTV